MKERRQIPGGFRVVDVSYRELATRPEKVAAELIRLVDEDPRRRAIRASRAVARDTAVLWSAVREVVEEAESHTEKWIDPRVQCTVSEARDYAVRAAVADLAVRLGLGETSVRTMGEHARRLAAAPALWSAFSSGRIIPQVARITAETMGAIPEEQWPAFGAQILDAATTQSPERFRKTAHALRDRIHRVSVETRHREAAAQRRVLLEHDLDGMSWLSLHLPSEQAVEVFERIDTTAHTLATIPGETRILDQLRADVAADLLTSTGSGGGAGVALTVTIPAATLLGGDQPGIVDGIGSVAPQTARDLAGRASSFARAFTDPDGRIVSYDPHEYRLPVALQRQIRMRDRTCRFPGCGRRARRCDIDHLHEAQHGGLTEPRNLMCLCRHHHRIKTLTRWTPHRPDPHSVRVAWRSPTGATWDTDPPPF